MAEVEAAAGPLTVADGRTRSLSIRWKLFLWMAVPIGAVLAVVLGLGLVVLTGRIEQGVDADLARTATHNALLFDSYLRRAAKVADEAAVALAAYPNIDDAGLYKLLQQNLRREPLVYGSAIAFEPGAFPGRRLFSPYVYRNGQTLRQTDIAESAYDYTAAQWDWFNAPRAAGHAVWTEPYFDDGAGNILMATYSVPVFRDGRFVAVVTADIPLQAIGSQLQGNFKGQQTFLVLSKTGRFVYNAYRPKLIGDPRPAGDWLAAQGRTDLADGFRRLLRARRGTLRAPDLGDVRNGAEQLLSFAPIGATDWTFVVGVSEAKALRPVRNATYAGLAVYVLLLALMLLVTWLASGTLTRRVAMVQHAAIRIADGDLSARTGLVAGDEVGRLAAAVDAMAAAIARREQKIVEINRGLESAVQKRTEELARSEAQFKSVVDRLPSGVMVRDLEGGALFANEQARRWLAVEDMFDVLGSRAEDTFAPQTAAEMTALDKAAAAGSLAHGHEMTMSWPDSHERTMLVSIFPITTAAGDMLGLGTVATDISERKRAEQELRRAYTIIQESVEYAAKMQRALLPDAADRAALGEHLMIWEPRDMVGGDMFWLRRTSRGLLVIVGDGTGHGVPGAFVTLVATSALNQALLDYPDGDPAAVLGHMNGYVKDMLRQGGEAGEADDGMELGLCLIEAGAGRISFAGARFSLLRVADGATGEIRGDRSGIGYRRVPAAAAFTSHVLQADPAAAYYLVTDGFVDQVGGTRHRAFGKRRLLAELLEIQDVPLPQQADILMATLEAYRGDEPRRDDITVVGFRVGVGAA